MFKLRTSNTLSSSSIACLSFGPGIAVVTVGPEGSLEKNGWAAAVRRDEVAKVLLAGTRAARATLERRIEAIVDIN